MGFLDNLESSLKSLESQEERDGSERQRRDNERLRSASIAPWYEKLKTSQYTKDLYDKATIAGHRRRTKVYLAWLGSTLRLEAKERRLDLRPTAEGIIAEFVTPDGEAKTEAVDLAGDPQELIEKWLSPEPAVQERAE